MKSGQSFNRENRGSDNRQIEGSDAHKNSTEF